MRLNLSRARWSAASLLLAALGFGAPLAAQSDGDKAAARRLAQDAIVAYRAERYEEALDKAQRAQALYDAPVHLLYMARALVKLGRLVEAAETYRTLGRLQLPANAPAPFREAIETAPVELAAFEAKIPLLRIEVSPAGAPGLELWLDGQPVSSALLGVERPVDPGEHRIKAKAAGKAAVEQSVKLGLGEARTVQLALTSQPGGASRKDQGADSAQGSAAPEAPAEAVPPTGAETGFFGGLRLGITVPSGDLYAEAPATDTLGAGAGLELRGGYRLTPRWAGALFVAGHFLRAKDDSPLLAGYDGDVQPGATGALLGVEGLFLAPRGRLGPFLGLGLGLESLDVKYAGEGCQRELKLRGVAVRATGGLQIPLGKSFQVSPFVTLSGGSFTTHELSGQCGDETLIAAAADADQASHSLFTLGAELSYELPGRRGGR